MKGAKKIVVTGGAGFIGSHLCDKLLQEGESVICMDNLLTGSFENIRQHAGNKRFEFIQHDIVDPYFIRDGSKIKQIYNLACPASPEKYQANPVRTTKTSTIGLINLLGMAREHGSRILQASTSEVYGDPLEHPQKETYRGNVNITGPRACYDVGKTLAETLMFDYKRMHGLEIRVARIFNTYGPRMSKDDGRVISNFVVQALQGAPITIQGDGSQTRSFCYYTDLVDGLYRLMNHKSFTGPVNLGNPTENTIMEIAQKVKGMIKSKSPLISTPLPQDDPKKRRPDISLAMKELKWQPIVHLEDGLASTIIYFEEVLRVGKLKSK